MTLLLTILLWVVTATVFVVTVLSMTTSTRWWVRMWDFPRLHVLGVAVAGILLAMLIDGPILAVLVLLGAATYQGHKILPFTRLTRPQIAFEPAPGNAAGIRLLASNVEMENTEHQKVADLIVRENPDVVLLMETDEVWHQAMMASLQAYPTVVAYPLSNHYGMIFATRLTCHSAKTVFLADDETPTVLAELEDASGKRFHFIGLHPRPPVPGDDTDERDEQIKTAATLTRLSDHPVIAMGDFNDVAWSWTTTRFKHHGQFLDPRIGRGLMSSFDARHPILRFPIDQFYVTKGIRIASYSLCNSVGSDHFPLKATVSIAGPRRDSSSAQNQQ